MSALRSAFDIVRRRTASAAPSKFPINDRRHSATLKKTSAPPKSEVDKFSKFIDSLGASKGSPGVTKPTFRQRAAARGSQLKEATFARGRQLKSFAGNQVNAFKNLSRGNQAAIGVGTAGAIGGAGVVNHRRNKRNKTQFRR